MPDTYIGKCWLASRDHHWLIQIERREADGWHRYWLIDPVTRTLRRFTSYDAATTILNTFLAAPDPTHIASFATSAVC
ncbi:hypothetical protein [Sulfobacillus thermosulfidooxidans]|uniref:hypothetical protein n=1 Tax=Sulfobacillus thermosulfidooxidans TaxID=28034 RepID=UPI000B0E1E31|nr:hypothetical protein [Sulfobacillus thermosulfidooxidans]